VYDHIRYRARGGVWRYSMVKNMWKFDLNRGHDLEMRDNWGRRFRVPWTKLNLGASIQQGDFNHRGEQGMFEAVGFRLFNLVGVAAPHTTFCTLRVIDDAEEASPNTQYEGDFWGVYLAIEQENGRFLEEHGLPDGNLYKMEGGTGELNNLGPTGPTDKSDLTYLQNNYTGASEAWWRTNWNLPSHYSYQAIVQAIHHYDIADGKNYFFYRNPVTRLWETCTWDLDLTWADNMYRAGQTGGDEPLKSRLLDNFANPGRLPRINIEFRNRVREIRDLLWNSDQAFKLIDEYAALLRGPAGGPTILDADRMMWDYNPKMNSSTYTPNLGKAGQGRFYQAGTPTKDFAGMVQLMKNYVGYRATNATFSLDTIAADPLRPNRPTLTYTGPTNYPVNRLTFRSSNFSAPGGGAAFAGMKWRIAAVTDTNAPGYRAGEPHRYEIETLWDSGVITTFTPDITIPANVVRTGDRYRVRVQFLDATGRASNWSPPHEFTCGEPVNTGDLLNHLRITEIMYNPPPGGYEFVELHNTSADATLDLAGVKFTQGIDFTFPAGTTIPPGGYLLVIGTANVSAFRSYYGLDANVPVAAAFTGSLNNAGERLVLRTAAGGTDIVAFTYQDGRGWPAATDGAGHSLVFSDAALAGQGSGAGDFAGNWSASRYRKGSPGRADSTPAPGVVLNEITAHTDFQNEFDSNDWIELYNPTDTDITLGPGWYLSDDASDLKKWMIPPGSVVPARGWLSFDEQTGFHFPTNTGFGLSKDGEQVFLSHLPGTAEDRVVDAVSFKAQENDWSLGRYPDGGAFWYQLTPRTRDAANGAPPARVAVTELLFHPPDLGGTNDNELDEFIEIHNGTADPVALWNTNRTWRLNGGVSFDFPTNLTLAAGEYLLVVSFDPTTNATQLAAFRSLYGLSPSAVRILGPYTGKLANDSDRVAVEKPLAPVGPGDFSWVVVDEVIYADREPWPCGADGSGNSLQRLDTAAHGSDPANWASEWPT
ncbi:MAG TPA: lamin tail domain-containing protein, partial [Methylomirabilota bacterium]|nr:lamin tail domain-containing protein [Methylomirabilota bacterium]